MKSNIVRPFGPKSFEDRVIEFALSEEEFVERILSIVENRMHGIIDNDQLARGIDAVHESAHVTYTQRGTSREEMRASDGDSRRAFARDEGGGQ